MRSGLEPKKIKSVTVSIVSPSLCHEVMGPEAMILVFECFILSQLFSLSSFTFIKRLFSSSLLSAIRVASPCLFNLYAEHVMRNARLCGISQHQQPQICGWYHPNGRERRGNNSLLMRVKEESEKSWLKMKHSKTKIMASGPITSWQINVETMEIVRDFLFLGSKITADRQGSLACCSPWGHKELDMTATELNWGHHIAGLFLPAA